MAINGKFSALRLGALALIATPLIGVAAHAGDEIVVSPAAAMAGWQKQTTARLDRALASQVPMRDYTGNTIVQIAFTRGADGKPANLTFYNQSGNWAERAIARKAVLSLDNLNQAPVAQAGEMHFLANLIFADSPADYKQLRSRLAKMENARVASNDVSRTYIALGY